MRARWITIKNAQDAHTPDLVDGILAELPPLAIGYDHSAWPRIKVIYLDDKN